MKNPDAVLRISSNKISAGGKIPIEIVAIGNHHNARVGRIGEIKDVEFSTGKHTPELASDPGERPDNKHCPL